MDPNATLGAILALLVDADHPDTIRDELVENLRALTDWIANGGFIPELSIVTEDDGTELFTPYGGS